MAHSHPYLIMLVGSQPAASLPYPLVLEVLQVRKIALGARRADPTLSFLLVVLVPVSRCNDVLMLPCNRG